MKKKVKYFFIIFIENFQGHIIVPFQSVSKTFTNDLKEKEILNTNGEVVGKVINNIYNCGIAMIDKEKLESSSKVKFSIDGLNTIIYDPISIWESIKDEFQIEKSSKTVIKSKTLKPQQNPDSYE